MKKILFAGDSYVQDCGFSPSNVEKFHWVPLFAAQKKLEYDNIAYLGMSNKEIFARTVEQLGKDRYDLVILMWGGLPRQWVYYAKNNVDDFTMINRGFTTGLNQDNEEVKQYAKLHFDYFDNRYVELKFWLCYVIALQNMFLFKEQPFIFIRGFDNVLDDFLQFDHELNDLSRLSEKAREMLDFDNRPDDFLVAKIRAVQRLIKQVNVNFWMNWEGPSFQAMQIDKSDDNLHPGPESNKQLLVQLTDYFDKNFSS